MSDDTPTIMGDVKGCHDWARAAVDCAYELGREKSRMETIAVFANWLRTMRLPALAADVEMGVPWGEG
jgi:hypothetical protein